jgi:hypothetical protein
MNEFQVPVLYEASGYITVKAKDAREAKQKIRALVVNMDYNQCEANIEMMPETPDLTVTGEPVLVEPDEV